MNRIFAVLLPALMTAAALPAQLRWEVVPQSQSPAPRFDHAMADWGFLFGGRDGSQAFADTWVLQGWGWRPVATTRAPSPRHGHALAKSYFFAGSVYHSVLLLFGGEDFAGNKDGSTWVFVGHHENNPGFPNFVGDWQPLAQAVSPSPRSGHAMVSDWATNTEFLLFGGATDAGPSNETWRFVQGAWQQVQTSTTPPARSGHTLTGTDRGYLLTGGRDGATQFTDSWLFDGVDWQQVTGPGFGGVHSAAVFHGFRHREVHVVTTAVGGGFATSVLERRTDGTWLAPLQTGGRPDRVGAAIVSGITPDLLFSFGGRDAQGQASAETLRLVPEHVASSTAVGTGCGPGPWGDNGPAVLHWDHRIGASGFTHVHTRSPNILVALGVQLGAAPAPTCQITVVPELVRLLVIDGVGRAECLLDVPFVPALAGMVLSHQALALEPLSPTGWAISNVTLVTIGD
jgi:hypothetical protein